jgi:hypothetical protein
MTVMRSEWSRPVLQVTTYANFGTPQAGQVSQARAVEGWLAFRQVIQ